MKLCSTLISLVITFCSLSAMAGEFYLLIDGAEMAVVKVASITDPEKVCYQIYGNSNRCDGYTSANKLHKILKDGHEAYKKLGLTNVLLQNRFIGSEKITKILRFNFITEDGYIGFSQGPSYSWNLNSPYSDSTMPSEDILILSPDDVAPSSLLNSLIFHPSVGKSWKSGHIQFTVVNVFENGLAEISESACWEKLETDCDGSYYTISLRKLENR